MFFIISNINIFIISDIISNKEKLFLFIRERPKAYNKWHVFCVYNTNIMSILNILDFEQSVK